MGTMIYSDGYYTPSVIRDLEEIGYYTTLICRDCKTLYAFITEDGKCAREIDGERCGGKICAVPF